MVKIFIAGSCSRCNEARELHKKLNIMGINTQLYDSETAEGLAECSFYGVDQIPSVLFQDKHGNMVGWRGNIPESASEIIERLPHFSNLT